MTRERAIISEIAIDDLQEQHKPVAESIGIESFLNLVKAYGGSSIYIPQMKEVTKLRIYRKISEEFDGMNIKQLANKYEVSESTVYNIVREQIQSGKHKHPQIPGQMSIVDMIEKDNCKIKCNVQNTINE